MPKNIKIQQDEIATITISKPEKLNALDMELLEELSHAFASLEKDTKAVFLRGAGDKAFVAGADVEQMTQLDKEGIVKFVDLGQDLMNQIEDFFCPVIAVVDGYALGGGFELALACDIILATEKARLGLPEVSLGLMPGFGGTQRIMKRTSIGQAKRLVFTGAHVKAEEALSLGLLDILVSTEELERNIEKLKQQFLNVAPLSVRQSKVIMNSYCRDNFKKALREERDAFIKIFETEDSSEGTKAFVEKRKAIFQGK